MEFAPGVPTWVLFAVSVVNLVLAFIAFRRREVRGSVPFALIMICVSLYAFGAGVRAASLTLSSFRVGSIIKYIGILGLGPMQLWFGLKYSGRESLLTRRRWALLLAWPALVFVLILTAPQHDLLWHVEGFVSRAPAASVNRVDTLVVSLNFVYQYTLILVTYILIAVVGIRRGGRYRRQVLLMLTGGIVPFVGSMILLGNRNPTSTQDPTAFAFTLTGIVFAIALFRFNFLDLVPIARHTVVDEMSDPVFVVDGGGRLVDVNTAGREMIDLEQGTAIGKAASDIIPFYDSINGDSGETDVDLTIEIDGSPRYFDPTRTTLTDKTGTTMGLLVIYHDVTERHIVEERFKRLIEGSSDIVAVMGADGTVTYVSESVENLLGYEPAELVGEHVSKRIHPDDREVVSTELSEYVDDLGYTGTLRVRFMNATGEWRILEVRAANLLGDPFVEGIVLNSRDVTEREERKRKLERQNERLDQFASIVSHDLRNPLSVAVGRLDILQPKVDSEHHESIDTIHRQLDRIDDIIDDSLTLARSGEVVSETDEVDLATVAGDAWKNVETEEATPVLEETLQFEADRNRLLNMFENLFRNSIEHNESTDITLRIGPLSDTFGFYVEDTGKGIAADVRDDVFEQGYTTNQDGTGFGLAIVKDIIEAHGWEISVTESEEGGARFEIECGGIPVQRQAQAA